MILRDYNKFITADANGMYVACLEPVGNRLPTGPERADTLNQLVRVLFESISGRLRDNFLFKRKNRHFGKFLERLLH